jgi:hypothetical protein
MKLVWVTATSAVPDAGVLLIAVCPAKVWPHLMQKRLSVLLGVLQLVQIIMFMVSSLNN